MKKLTQEQVDGIKTAGGSGVWTQTELATSYGISQSHVSRILSGTRCQGKQSSRNRNLTDGQVQDIRLKAMSTTMSQTEIGIEFGSSVA